MHQKSNTASTNIHVQWIQWLEEIVLSVRNVIQQKRNTNLPCHNKLSCQSRIDDMQ